MDKKLLDVLMLGAIFIFSVVLFSIVLFFKLTPQMNGLIIIADIIFIVLSFNYLLHRKGI